MSVDILIPVLNRPHRVEPVLQSIADSTLQPHTVWFIVSPSDFEERNAISMAGLGYMISPGGFAAKINEGVRQSRAELIFIGADDLCWHPGWLEEAMTCLTPGIGLVGVNDMIYRGTEHATHFLITREYADQPTIDGQSGPVCEVYHHCFCDNELIETAKARGAYRYAEKSIVEHLHPIAGKSENDSVYSYGMSHFYSDEVLFKSREHLWA